MSEADRERMKRNMLHAVQVQEGVVPADSPDDFTVPQPLDSKGRQWFLGGGQYHPTEEALEEFSNPKEES